MFQRALDSFKPFTGPIKCIFIVRQDAEDEYHLATDIKQLRPDAHIVMLRNNTRGAVETCMLAKDLINDGDPLCIMDCDFYFESKSYFDCLDSIVDDRAYDGCLMTFTSGDPRYSYAKANAQDIVTRTAEKEVISDHAIWGAYCFGSGKIYKQAAEALLAKPLGDKMKEYYTSYLYNALIAAGKSIKLTRVDYAESYGTPEELTASLASTIHTDQ
jgi:hypothetical protein